MIPSSAQLSTRVNELLGACGVSQIGGDQSARTPINGASLGMVGTAGNVDDTVTRSAAAFRVWRETPAPLRGELIRRLGDVLREHKAELGELVSIESGKIRSEGLGEVQEMIDICEFAVGLSRQLHGLTIASERPGHRLMESWHPMGPIAVITAFNFPVAVWSWNAALALVCGNTVIWKPSDKAPITAIACDALFRRAAAQVGAPADINQVLLGGYAQGAALIAHEGVPVVSATGSTAMGRKVSSVVASRFGRSILELGGNNAAIVAPSADLDLTIRGIVFSAAGTAGQRCTSLRRLVLHRSIHDQVVERVGRAYSSLTIGNPLADGVLVGPLIDRDSFDRMQNALRIATSDGGTLVAGGERAIADEAVEAFYARPALVTMPAQSQIVRTETFAPILYAMVYDDFDEAVHIQNDVPQGLSSSIFTNDLREAERFMSVSGSDCGIANVNIGPSGAEIGGAFGGEKETGGGRESGSDAWRGYMRRATNTVNYSTSLPLAQGVKFDFD